MVKNFAYDACIILTSRRVEEHHRSYTNLKVCFYEN